MAASDLGPLFPILKNADLTSDAPSASTAGDSATGKVGLVSFPFRDSSGNVITHQLDASGRLQATSYQGGTWTTGRTWTLSNGTDSIAAVQSGTWTVQQGTPPWSVSQSGTWTVQQGTPPWSVVGNVAAGASDSGNPVKIGGVYNSTLPTLTNGQRGDVQLSSKGTVIVSGAAPVGSPPSADPVTIAGVDTLGNKQYLKESTAGHPLVDLNDGSGNAITSQAAGTQRALDVDIVGFSTSSNTRPNVTTSSSTILAANTSRKYAYIMNNSGSTIYIKFGAAAVLNQGIPITSGGMFEINKNNLFLGAINAIKSGGTVAVDVYEGTP